MLTANSLGGEDPVWTLIKSYEETCHDLRELRAQISSLQAQESVLEAKRISVQSILAHVCPARDQLFATSDIMERIFVYAVCPTAGENTEAFYSESHRYSDAYPVVHSIARVCSLWRATAIHTPRLWQRIIFSGWRKSTEIDFPCASFRLRSWLRRSFPLPLTIHWNDDDPGHSDDDSIHSDDASNSDNDSTRSDEPGPWTMRLFDSLVAHSARWHAVTLWIPFPRYCSYFPIFLPNLKDLHLYNTGDDPIPVLGSMPLLRNLAISGGDVSEGAFPWQQLTTLRIFNDIGIPTQAIQACRTLESLYVDMDDYVPPFVIDHATTLPSLRHLSIFFPLELMPLTFLDLTVLESMSVNLQYNDLPPDHQLAEFLERCSNLTTLQIKLNGLGSHNYPRFSSNFHSRTVRVLKLRLVEVLCLGRRALSDLLKLFTASRLTEQFSALEEIHIDCTCDLEGDYARSIETVAFTALGLASSDAQGLSLRSIWLHIPPTLVEPLSYALSSCPKLHVSSTPLDFDFIGVNCFMDGDLLLPDKKTM
ncbi:hypothetical protein DL96DRAFT_375654 [Flagelloscypha sp. PMI_526]|nr:hypothetical protein DL96DRAFT_375654 [Flagelloscypha sp. PMI_526]